MILCTHADFGAYAALHPGFAVVLHTLRTHSLLELPEGRTDLDGERVFVLANHAAWFREQAPLECHRRHIDVQVVLAGSDHMAWAALEALTQLHTPYDPATDIAFYDDEPQLWMPVHAGQLAIFFPEDAHAPLVGSGQPVHKLVFKVQV